MKKLTNTKTVAELFLYAALVVMGASIVFNPWVGATNPLLYIAVMFLIFACFAFFAYFLGKEEGDYELLLLSLVDVVMAVLIYYFRNGNLPVLLSFTLSAWAFFYVSLKLITAFQYKDTDNRKYLIKNLIAVVILLISTVTIFRLFNDDVVLVLTLYGYYFIIVAALNFLEVCLYRVDIDNNDEHTFRLMSSTANKKAKVAVKAQDKPVVKAPVKKPVAAPKKKSTTSASAVKKTAPKKVASKPATKKVAPKAAPKKTVTKKTTTKKTTKKSK